MNPAAFDRLARLLAAPTSRRLTVLGGVAAVLVGVDRSRPRRLGATGRTASPVASPLTAVGATPVGSPRASPSPLDLVGGTPS